MVLVSPPPIASLGHRKKLLAAIDDAARTGFAPELEALSKALADC